MSVHAEIPVMFVWVSELVFVRFEVPRVIAVTCCSVEVTFSPEFQVNKQSQTASAAQASAYV